MLGVFCFVFSIICFFCGLIYGLMYILINTLVIGWYWLLIMFCYSLVWSSLLFVWVGLICVWLMPCCYVGCVTYLFLWVLDVGCFRGFVAEFVWLMLSECVLYGRGLLFWALIAWFFRFWLGWLIVVMYCLLIVWVGISWCLFSC